MDINITTEANEVVPVEMVDQNDGTFLVAYTPTAPGPLQVNVGYSGNFLSIDRPPIVVQVQPPDEPEAGGSAGVDGN